MLPAVTQRVGKELSHPGQRNYWGILHKNEYKGHLKKARYP